MTDEQKAPEEGKPAEEAPAEDKKDAPADEKKGEEGAKDEKQEEKKDEPEDGEPEPPKDDVAVKSLTETVKELKTELKSLADKHEVSEKTVTELKSRLAAAEKLLGTPELKSKVEDVPTDAPATVKTPLQMLG